MASHLDPVKWVNDAETEDSESLDTPLQMNDQINTVLERYEAFKRRDYVAAANPIPAELTNNNNAQLDSLIDFDNTASTNTNTGGGAGGINDLAGIFAVLALLAVSQYQAFRSSSPLAGGGMPTYWPAPATAHNTDNSNGFGGLRLGGRRHPSSIDCGKAQPGPARGHHVVNESMSFSHPSNWEI
ncbi:hypothetical protein P691DRAFT_789290 [Macrolepiota fuliginosa MF-IS2]|uniref:Uncharacterized protein n=1 Tax=Macrolepiota fuliginosa MF-IS2 TaxID=1400762 RepID=A0A9P5XHG4_9AGAR|nr:hypothetical protein P691DRAFT_789290 [Macrolepiota fuliginosa MF-IS2]